MNASFDPFHLVNTYGAFGTVGRRRFEVIVEGTDGEPDDDSAWREYEFKGKPGDPRRMPPQVAPYHLRLDWLMWFLPLSPSYGGEWFTQVPASRPRGRFGDASSPSSQPVFGWTATVHPGPKLFHRFSTKRERRATGEWWVRTFDTEYVPAVGLEDFVRRDAA